MLLFVSFLKTKVMGIKFVHKMASRRRLQMTDEKDLSHGICHARNPHQ